MSTEFRLPELGENVEKGDLLKLLVEVGDTISKDQPVLELETEKATIEVPTSIGGQVKAIHVKPGDNVKVGQLILTVEEDGTEAKSGRKAEAKSGEKDEAEGRSREELKPGPAAKAEATAESKTQADTASVSKPETKRQQAAPKTGGPEEQAAKPQPVKENSEEPARGEAQPMTAPEAGAPAVPRAEVVDISRARPTTELDQPEQIAPAAPSVRRQARELGVDINRVRGSGPAGRISADDVTEYAHDIITGAGGPAALPVRLPDFSKWGEVDRQPMSNVRRKTAEHMALAWNTVPQVTQYDNADITALDELRKRYARKAEEAGGKLTVTAILVKVVVSALRVFPQFAASVDVERNEVIYKKYTHIGVAVDTERGLLVPVIRDADKKNILEISRELARLAEKARNRKLAPEEMQGGVFTITNLGGIGGTSFSPIVNYPEVAILGVARASLQPVCLNGGIMPRLVLPLSLSYDHRLIDGADAARFLRWVAEALEQPFLLSLQG